ncbi:histidine phosphotransferase family protein [Marivita sp. S6314]|uniref:histidine phosphotransferase family protein n=1 Tax=Marivita sp. S6314 TaxID=2926406 RepID=UPI001FF6BBCA|nr:histidine phosphotransferase family protein [Marivita sp. S6314]
MQHPPSSLAALIGSRICHDLINPLGAISNGLELVSLTAPSPASPEMMLIQQSCDNATARIQFFRIAFGGAGDSRTIPNAQAARTLADHYVGTRLRTEWTLYHDIGRDAVQLAYLAVLCAETALQQGGLLSVGSDGPDLIITGQGPVCVPDRDLWAILSMTGGAPLPELRPAHVQFALLRHLSADDALAVEDGSADGRIMLRLTLPQTPNSGLQGVDH